MSVGALVEQLRAGGITLRWESSRVVVVGDLSTELEVEVAGRTWGLSAYLVYEHGGEEALHRWLRGELALEDATDTQQVLTVNEPILRASRTVFAPVVVAETGKPELNWWEL